MLPGILEPRGQVVECISSGDVVDQKGARSAAVVRSGDGTESLLAGLGQGIVHIRKVFNA